MPDIQDTLESIAEEYANKTTLAQDEVFSLLLGLVEGKTPEEAIIILTGLNIGAVLTLKLSATQVLFEQGIISILESMYSTTTLSEEALRSLMQSVDSKLSSKFTSVVGNDMRTIIIDGIATGKGASIILADSREKLEKLGHSFTNAKKEIQTGFSQYSNSVTNMMAEKLPPNTKFIYIGAYDSKTREECIDRINMGEVTRKQILGSKFGNMDNAIWNCRHKWEQLSDDKQGQGYEPEKFERNNA